jgi:hypothetical protein
MRNICFIIEFRVFLNKLLCFDSLKIIYFETKINYFQTNKQNTQIFYSKNIFSNYVYHAINPKFNN